MLKLIEKKSGVKAKGRPASDQQIKIAEAAYYLAEKRGFEPGHELEDWLTAECMTNEAHRLN